GAARGGSLRVIEGSVCAASGVLLRGGGSLAIPPTPMIVFLGRRGGTGVSGGGMAAPSSVRACGRSEGAEGAPRPGTDEERRGGGRVSETTVAADSKKVASSAMSPRRFFPSPPREMRSSGERTPAAIRR